MSKPLDRLNVFISGPMSDDPRNHICEFLDAHRRLNELGAAHVHDPAAQWVSEVSHGLDYDRSHEHYMRECVHELTRMGYGTHEGCEWGFGDLPPYYDLLVQLDGWEKSMGARVEAEVAEACGIEVVEMRRLDSWIETRGGQ